MSGRASTPTEQTARLGTEALRIHLLGLPSVMWAGRALPIPRRQARALLYRLAIRAQPVPREQLCYLFWPDIPDASARRHLSHLLWHLQHALPDPELLWVGEDGVGLDAKGTWSDAVAFERLHSVGTVEALQQAVGLYRGPFLSGFSVPGCPEFESWAVGERYAFEHRYLETLATLLEQRVARGQHQAAIDSAQRYLATDELAEGVHRRLIELYALTGDRSAALRQYERCAVILERELGVSPLPETRAAYESALQGRRPRPPASKARPPGAVLPGLRVPLEGRQDTLRRLEQAWTQAQRGQAQVVLIGGEAGIGKSRLMYEFADQNGDKALVLAGACHSVTRSLPYHPLIEALRPVVSKPAEGQGNGGTDLPVHPLPCSLPPVWLAEVTRLLPELRSLCPGLPPPLPGEPEEARSRLFEALGRLVLALAGGPLPLLLALDDLHWADRATLDWLGYLAHHLSDRDHFASAACRLLVLGTYRSEEAQALAELRRSLARAGTLVELELPGLDAEAVWRIVEHLIPPASALGEPDQAVPADRLQRATGGNPFFLLETVRAFLEAGHPAGDLAELARFPLPDTIRLAVKRRLDRLSPQARQVLEAGAVLGGTFAFDLVRRTAGRGEVETLDGLEELVARHFLQEGDGGIGFRHDLIRRAVAEDLSPVRRQLLHRRAGRALERLRPEAVSALAYHFEAGGDGRRALHYHGLAAQQAEVLFAWQEAEEHQDRMLALLAQIDPDGASPDCLEQRGQILTERAHSRFLQGRLEDRDGDLAALVSLAEATGEDRLRLLAAVHRVRYHNLGGEYADAVAEVEAHLSLARQLGDAASEARLLVHAGFAHYFLGQPQAALGALEAAVEAAGGEVDAGMRGRVSHILGYVHYHLGDYPRALEYHREAYDCAVAIRDQNRMAWSLMDAGFIYLKLGQFSEARDCLEESLAMARRIAARPAEAYALTLLADWELYRGAYAVALGGYGECLVLQMAVHSQHGILAAEGGAAFALYHLGDLDEARDTFRRGLERARDISHQRHIGLALIGLALVELVDEPAASPAAACGLLAEALAGAQECCCAENEVAALAALARCRRYQKDPTEALHRAQQAVRVARDHDFTACLAWAEVEAGLALLVLGDLEAALAHTTRAVEGLPGIHEAWIGTEEVHLAHARVLQALGQVEAAEEHLRLAEAAVAQKANLISDADPRRRYLSFARRSLPAQC
jgi:DNA-binding SARP family transcriptional activator/tetratricopeptide (TPR) repeat protein